MPIGYFQQSYAPRGRFVARKRCFPDNSATIIKIYCKPGILLNNRVFPDSINKIRALLSPTIFNRFYPCLLFHYIAPLAHRVPSHSTNSEGVICIRENSFHYMHSCCDRIPKFASVQLDLLFQGVSLLGGLVVDCVHFFPAPPSCSRRAGPASPRARRPILTIPLRLSFFFFFFLFFPKKN